MPSTLPSWTRTGASPSRIRVVLRYAEIAAKLLDRSRIWLNCSSVKEFMGRPSRTQLSLMRSWGLS